MEKNISITVPMEHGALIRASEMFAGLASDLMLVPAENPKQTKMVVEEVAPVTVVPTPEAVPAAPTPTPEPEAAEVFAPAAVAPEATPAPVAVAPEATPAPVAVATTTGAELDINGLPWDNRIHAGTKTKLVTGAWKNKRNLDPTLLATVEAELRGAVSAPETVLQEPVAEVAPTPAQTAVAPTPTPEAVPPAPTGAVTTFPALMTAITANNISPQVVSGAIQAVGLASLPLLAARTDLIPAVAERLGL